MADSVLNRQMQRIFGDVNDELFRATGSFKPFHNAHEGYAVVKEEVDELWDAIKTKGIAPEVIRKEAIQIAAMAIRFVLDVCDACPGERDAND